MSEDARRVGPRPLSVEMTPRYRVMWHVNRRLVRLLFDIRADGLERWPDAPFQLVLQPALVPAARGGPLRGPDRRG